MKHIIGLQKFNNELIYAVCFTSEAYWLFKFITFEVTVKLKYWEINVDMYTRAYTSILLPVNNPASCADRQWK